MPLRRMALFLTEHRHEAERCPAGNPQMAGALLALIGNAAEGGLKVHAEAVTRGQHHLYVIVEGANADAVRRYFAPFGQLGTLTVTPASRCEEVVDRGAC